MQIRLKPTTVAGMLVCQQLEVGDRILYTLPYDGGFETDFMKALEMWISEANLRYWSYKTNVKGRRDATEWYLTLKTARDTVMEMVEYKNEDGEICSEERPW